MEIFMGDAKSNLTFEAMIDMLEQTVSSGESINFSPAGKSMWPTIRDRLDTVIISPAPDIKKYDIALYRRRNGKIVLHRVVKLIDRDTYVMCGDSQFQLEHPIKRSQVIGVVSRIRRKGKLIDCENPSFLYRLYVRLWDLRLILDKLIYSFLRFRKKLK